ncbi:MAG: HesB/IscA family protein [Sandaracinobacteroides sp.]
MEADMPTTGIALTSAAAARVAAIAARQGSTAPRLRLSVDGGGCAGFQYRFELSDAPEADDIETLTDGVGLVVDSTSLPLLSGSVVDFVESLGGAAFQVRNPNAASNCGCGTSFSV